MLRTPERTVPCPSSERSAHLSMSEARRACIGAGGRHSELSTNFELPTHDFASMKEVGRSDGHRFEWRAVRFDWSAEYRYHRRRKAHWSRTLVSFVLLVVYLCWAGGGAGHRQCVAWQRGAVMCNALGSRSSTTKDTKSTKTRAGSLRVLRLSRTSEWWELLAAPMVVRSSGGRCGSIGQRRTGTTEGGPSIGAGPSCSLCSWWLISAGRAGALAIEGV